MVALMALPQAPCIHPVMAPALQVAAATRMTLLYPTSVTATDSTIPPFEGRFTEAPVAIRAGASEQDAPRSA